jgi:hypothetical protein
MPERNPSSVDTSRTGSGGPEGRRPFYRVAFPWASPWRRPLRGHRETRRSVTTGFLAPPIDTQDCQHLRSAARPRRLGYTLVQRHTAAAKRPSFSAPSTGIDLEVKVLSEIGHSNRSEPQGRDREESSGGSGERNRGPTYRNRIRGGAEQGERAESREALVTKARRRIPGGRAGKVDVSYLGRSRLMPERATPDWSPPRRSEKSAEAVVVGQMTTKGRTVRRAKRLWISIT